MYIYLYISSIYLLCDYARMRMPSNTASQNHHLISSHTRSPHTKTFVRRTDTHILLLYIYTNISPYCPPSYSISKPNTHQGILIPFSLSVFCNFLCESSQNRIPWIWICTLCIWIVLILHIHIHTCKDIIVHIFRTI